MVHEVPFSHRLLGATLSAPASLPPRRYAPHLAHAVSAMRFQCTLLFSTSCVGSPRSEADNVLGAGPAERSDAFAGTLPSLCTLQTIRQDLHVSLTRRSAFSLHVIAGICTVGSTRSPPSSSIDSANAKRRKLSDGVPSLSPSFTCAYDLLLRRHNHRIFV